MIEKDFVASDSDPTNDSSKPFLNVSVFKNIPRKQKIAIFILAIGAIAIIVFWAWQFNNRLSSPFSSSNDNKINAVSNNSSSTTAVDLRNVDTDHDGLSDYDEINIYHTSPYLEDTDSDGIPDNVEVKNGTDPNCPTGKVCNGADNTAPTASSTATSTSINNVPILSLPTDLVSSSQQILQNALDGKADAATLRLLLTSSGADKAMLDQISDEDLMKSYQESLQNQP